MQHPFDSLRRHDPVLVQRVLLSPLAADAPVSAMLFANGKTPVTSKVTGVVYALVTWYSLMATILIAG